MARPSSLNIAKKDIFMLFSKASQKIYSETEIAGVLREHRHTWRLG
jgi:hypothetical protein